MPRARLGREVRPGVERPALGRREDRQRPAEVPGERGRGRHVGGVDLGMLLAVDLDRDEAAR